MRIGVKPSKLALKTMSMCYGEMIGVASLSSISNTNINERCCWCTIFQTNLALCRQILWIGKHRGFYFCIRDNVVSTGLWCAGGMPYTYQDINGACARSSLVSSVLSTHAPQHTNVAPLYTWNESYCSSPSHLRQLDFNGRLRAHASHTHTHTRNT